MVPTRPAWIALQFLTRLPLQLKTTPDPEQKAQSLLWYPLVGAFIGAALMGLAILMQNWPPPVAAALLLLFWVVATGGLHLDGLADSADAWAGGLGNPERSLSIMQDPAAGPIGVVSLVLVLLLKFAALQAALSNHDIALLWLAPVFGRAAILGLFLSTPYVRRRGLGADMAQHGSSLKLMLVLGLTLTVGLIVGQLIAGMTALLGLLIFLWIRAQSIRRLGGFTGDVAGSVIEVVEAVVLLLLVIFSI
ncbi:adenosylcobinamide-GDP ribazoletransferase [Litorivivens sp.]|uniref:adenosylcobinamide-GDP ribazoletransferase n=1 Tax=Litorivivens sp. TaxID=2020868 RepID=UPI003568DCF1